MIRKFDGFEIGCRHEMTDLIRLGPEALRVAYLLLCHLDPLADRGRWWSKKEILERLGYQTTRTWAYGKVQSNLESLAHAHYRLASGESYDPLIQKMEAEHRRIWIQINEEFQGCVPFLISDRKLPGDIKQSYDKFPTKLLVLSKGYGLPELLAALYLIRERGNPRHRSQTEKEFVLFVRTLMDMMHIQTGNASINYQRCLRALQQLQADAIISRLEPDLSDLHRLPPHVGRETKVKIYVKHTRLLDDDLGRLLVERGAAQP
jgi:hypothetical protein